MSILLGKALGTSSQFWLNLQDTYDLKQAEFAGLPAVEPLVRASA